jgi:nucleoside-diphosphate-sugar epimerase
MGISSGPTKAIKAAVLRRPYIIGFTGAVDLQYVRDTARIFIRCAEREIPGAKVYTPRGCVVRVEEFIRTLEQLLPEAEGLIQARGKRLPIASDLDDSALRHDLGEDLHTPLEEGIRETANIFERLERDGRLETTDLER